MKSPSHGPLAFTLLACGAVAGLAGTDFILPVIPHLPALLGGTATEAQYVLAAFLAGAAVGLFLFGSLASRYGPHGPLIAAFVGYALTSLASAFSTGIEVLIGWRFLQGIAAAAPAVIAPGVIRVLFDETGATKAIALIGSLESLAPAFAPILGAWLFTVGGWRAPFIATALIAALLAAATLVARSALAISVPEEGGRSYAALLRSPVFLRYALSQAFVLGGLLIFVFGAPVVIVSTLGGELRDFIIMQVVGVVCFVAFSNASGFLVQRFGAEALISAGSHLAAVSSLAILGYALAGGREPSIVTCLFAPMNIGLGLRGPPGFLRAIIAGEGDDNRAASLTILAIIGVAALGTALLAPFIETGLVALAAAASGAELIAIAVLVLLPPLPDE